MLHYKKNWLYFFIISFILTPLHFSAQDITLEEIWNGAFFPLSINNVISTKDGNSYTVLTNEGIDKYSYKTFQKLETLISGKFTGYEFSPDESLLLLEENATYIYSHSKKGEYKIYNIRTRAYSKVFEGKPVQEPLFSPDGSKIAFVYENNIYYQDLSDKKVIQITTDGEKNKIINGVSDWVYEEELGIVRNFEWSPDSRHIAYIRFDESLVKEISLPVYNQKLYPENWTFKYPKAGEENSKVSLHLFSIEKNSSATIPLTAVENYYILKIKFSPLGSLFTLTSNRLQNKIDISSITLSDQKIQKLVSETSKTWIDTDNIFIAFLANGNFIINSDKSGYNHLYLYNKEGKLLNPITQGDWEITEIYGINNTTSTIYYQSTEKGANNRVIGYSNIVTGKTSLLSTEEGTHQAIFNANYSAYINIYSTTNTPPIYTLRNTTGEILKVLEDNNKLQSFITQKHITPLEFIDIPSGKGEYLKAYIIKPIDFNPNKKHPVLMYVYGGPGAQTVTNTWDSFNYWWYQMLAQQGYIIVSVDGRGTGGRGEKFKKAIYKNLGKLELDDQITAAQWLQKQTYVDAQRIGIWGWSFGGYLTSLCMTKANGLFKMGIAVAPVTNWRYYDTLYTERFLQTPQENPTGYNDNSPINFAQNLKGNYLIIHGTADDNVHFQNTVEMIEALTQNAKEFDMAIYPDKDHGIYGGATRYQLYKKMTNYIKQNL